MVSSTSTLNSKHEKGEMLMLKENVLEPLFTYIFENENVATLCSMLFTIYFAYLLMKLTIGGLKRWYRLFMIS